MKISHVLITLAMGISFFGKTFGQTKPKAIDSKVIEAIIYLQGAQLVSEGSANLSTGTHELVFGGLPNGINPSAIQVAGPKESIILEVRHFVNYLKPAGKTPEILKLEDSLKYYQKKIEEINILKAVLEEERKLILANQNLRGDDQGLKVEELVKAADFFRHRLGDIADRQAKHNLNIEELNESKNRIHNQLREWNALQNQPSNDIVIKMQATREGKHDFYLKYYTQNAGWTPRYDLRVDDTKSKTKLDLRADVTQNTGVDFQKVRLTLSSGNPMLGGNKPELDPWFVYAYLPSAIISSGRSKNLESMAYGAPAQAREEAMAEEDMKAADKFEPSGATLADFTSVAQGATSVFYEIKLAQDLPSDNQNHQVFIQNYDLPASYRHFAVPKKDNDAFLVASLTDWERFDLLPGIMSIYFEGAFVTESTLNPTLTMDTLDISLGRDKKVVVKREQIKDFYDCKTFGGNKEHHFGFEITVRNTKNEMVDLVLQDQIPISQNKDLIVKVLDETLNPTNMAAPEYDKEKGFITWRLKLKPQESVKIVLKYEIKHPKDLIVDGL